MNQGIEPTLENHIISSNPKMLEIIDSIKRMAGFSANVLIFGESGTGKELLASLIHNSSNRANKKFVAVNCGAIPENLIESELFGYKKGAFTDATKDRRGLIEEANGGTLFLDEIGEMPLLQQVKLLRVLQSKELRMLGDEQIVKLDLRVVAASNKNLAQLVSAGLFREDLFYRLNVVNFELPPLRQRLDDLPLLIEFLLKKLNAKLKLPPKKLSSAAQQRLTNYSWPGNIRELENVLERSLLLCQQSQIELSDLPDYINNFSAQLTQNDPVQLNGQIDNSGTTYGLSLKLNTQRLENKLIQEALLRTSGNRTHAAKLLEISHRALLYKIKEYGLNNFMKN